MLGYVRHSNYNSDGTKTGYGPPHFLVSTLHNGPSAPLTPCFGPPIVPLAPYWAVIGGAWAWSGQRVKKIEKHRYFFFRCGSNEGSVIEYGAILADFGCGCPLVGGSLGQKCALGLWPRALDLSLGPKLWIPYIPLALHSTLSSSVLTQPALMF